MFVTMSMTARHRQYLQANKSTPHTLILFRKIHLNIILPFTTISYKRFLFALPNNPVRVSLLSHACNIHGSSYIPRFDHTNDIWSRVGLQIMKLLTMQFHAAFCHFLPVRSKNLSNHSCRRPTECVLPPL
jgi:hypothetical protein